jgi:hypothetical protein
MAKKRKKSPPSRKKYDENNPVVSFRVSKELYDRLQAVKRAEGKSITDVLKVGVGLLEVKVRKEKEIRDKAFTEGNDKGIEEGYAVAEEAFKVTYLCSKCRKPIELDSPEEKQAASRYMTENGWGHGDCINPKH